jgi:hypothetical protein
MSLTQAISTYSFVDAPAIDFSGIDSALANAALLIQINSLMASAAASFNARRYGDAINTYHAAESLIYAHLDPEWTPELGLKLQPLLPRDSSLFTPLLAAASQWLNILPVPTPASPVRPPSAVDPHLLASVAGLHGAGLTMVATNPTATMQALADLDLAAIYTEQDNTAATTAALTRAKSLDANLVATLAPSTSVPAAPAGPVPASAPAAPVVVTTISPALSANVAVQSDVIATGGPKLSLFLSPLRTPLPITVLAQKQVGLLTGSGTNVSTKSVQWSAGGNPDVASITSILYAPHVLVTTLPDALTNTVTLWERAAVLPHDYFYVIPLALAQCYQALGDYANAETYYLQAAGYAYINTAIEGPYVWVQLASLYRDWGNSAYRKGDRTTAASVYGNVLTSGSAAAPSTPLYTMAGLATAAKIAKTLIPQLPTLASTGVGGLSADDTAIASVLLQIYGKAAQISAGLDYWGTYAAAVPIWTFSYLQRVAINFTQLALQAEQQVINYWSQADAATLTMTELTNQVAQANGHVNAAKQELAQAKDQAQAYQAALTLAQTRASDATKNASEYLSTNSQAIIIEATGQQVSGGDDGDYQRVDGMAFLLLSGEGIAGSRGTVAAATQLAANQVSQKYQVDSMNRTTTEMQQAATQAQAQLTAATAQVAAANANLAVAQLEANGAAQTLSVFSSDTFSPQVWRAMGDFVASIYARYMDMALRTAKLMEQAYNFENDLNLTYVKDSYQGVVDGLLAADALMADIQTFTEDLVTSNRGKKQLVKTSISLARRYGYLFQTQLVKTGHMAFETTLDDFDSAFPGSYQGRIRRVTVDVQGIVPPTGISGSLSNNGVSLYRLPSDIATPTNPSKVRIQSAETLIISDYNPVVDGVISSETGEQMGIFEGAGVASTWTMSIPKQLNDINYGTLTDVVLTFLYETRFDPQLVPVVLKDLSSRPGYYDREWAIPLGWLYPDLFYGFVKTGTLTLSLSAADLALNQTNPTITAVSVLVAIAPGKTASGITLSLTAPGKPAVSSVTDATGAVTSQGAGSTWAGAVGGSAYGDWVITLPVASNPSLVPGGKLDLSPLVNLVLVLDYSFTPRS